MSTQPSPYTELQLDALRELANIGSGQAAAALSSLLGKAVDISVPTAALLPLNDAVAVAGEPDDERHGILVPIVGDMLASVVLLVPDADAHTLTAVYGLDPHSADGRSMLQEVGNIVGTSYINVLAQMTGMALEPSPPQVTHDMLGAILASVLLGRGSDLEVALILDSDLRVEEEECSISFLLLPDTGGVDDLLTRIGL
ncbi:chemotaxis protein CheC [Paraconexibacter sp.]|uniref:chemotaxis protein CheC n=1 Tax=Paraconexibacter sp. TaxID=2949640 RepID=UPI0035657BEE